MTVWPLFGNAEEPATTTCPHCGAAVPVYASYCEVCGSSLTPTGPMPAPETPTGADSSQTRRLGQRASQITVCPQCGGRIDADGYCALCGSRAPSARDHIESSPAPWIAGVSDIGLVHSRNEDALALWADDAAPRAVLVVCDGVSTSAESDVASLAAAERAREVLVDALRGGMPLDEAFRQAASQANAAVIEHTQDDSSNTASATLAAAVVDGDQLGYANLGDSRVYWIGENDETLLSTDDSMAQAFIDQGMARAAAESMPQAHAITKWLGRDSDDIVPDTGTQAMAGPGWVLVCSDGLWNYASEPAAIAALVREFAASDAEPAVIARRLVTWTNDRGGHDNVTVALARHEAGDHGPIV